MSAPAAFQKTSSEIPDPLEGTGERSRAEGFLVNDADFGRCEKTYFFGFSLLIFLAV